MQILNKHISTLDTQDIHRLIHHPNEFSQVFLCDVVDGFEADIWAHVIQLTGLPDISTATLTDLVYKKLYPDGYTLESGPTDWTRAQRVADDIRRVYILSSEMYTPGCFLKLVDEIVKTHKEPKP